MRLHEGKVIPKNNKYTNRFLFCIFTKHYFSIKVILHITGSYILHRSSISLLDLRRLIDLNLLHGEVWVHGSGLLYGLR